MSKKAILFAAGGTGGHLFPAQQLGEMLKKDFNISFAGHGLSRNPFFQKTEYHFEEINAAFLGKHFIVQTWKGFWKALLLIRQTNPCLVVGFGSYHAFPVLLAALILRKKLVLFEANRGLGKVNRFFAPFAHLIGAQFSLSSFQSKMALVPLLPWEWKEKKNLSQAEARLEYGLDPNIPTILIFGGSQGACFFNEIMTRVMMRVNPQMQVIHLTGNTGAASYENYLQKNVIKKFETNMHQVYLAADLVICRAGASTIAELIHYELPSLMIPFPFAAENHQKTNALFLQNEVGGGICVEQTRATEETIQKSIEILWETREEKKKCISLFKKSSSSRLSLADHIRSLI